MALICCNTLSASQRVQQSVFQSMQLPCCLGDAYSQCSEGGTLAPPIAAPEGAFSALVVVDLDLKTIIQLKCAIFKCCSYCAPIIESKLFLSLAVVVQVKDPKRIKVANLPLWQ